MDNTIICPNCKKPIPLTEALSHQLKEKYTEFYKKRLAQEKEKLSQELQANLRKKIKTEIELELKDKVNEANELKEQNKHLQNQLLELNKLIRQLRQENETKKIELERQLIKEEERIRQEEKKRFDEEYRLKMLEKEKQLTDMRKQIEELKRKSEISSQQLQGEVQELALEKILQEKFPFDQIEEVPKGIRGADVIQIVKNRTGKICGKIIWESKRTKNWSDGWLIKLKEDQRKVKAEIAVIVSSVLPADVLSLSYKDGVWISNFEAVYGLALALRNSLIEVYNVKSSIVGRQEKKEILWNYLTSIEFRQRIEAVYEAYSQLMSDLKKEKDWFVRKWAKQEKNIEKVAENILGIHGDLQGIVGRSLPEIKGLEVLPETTQDEKNKLF